MSDIMAGIYIYVIIYICEWDPTQTTGSWPEWLLMVLPLMSTK